MKIVDLPILGFKNVFFDPNSDYEWDQLNERVFLSGVFENLSNLILESMACKTPVVAFDIGGNSDIISHKTNGYLATPYSTEDLLNGIEYMFNGEDLGKEARSTIETNFSKNIVHMEYLKLYKSLVE